MDSFQWEIKDATTSFENELTLFNLKAKVVFHVRILVIRERQFVNKLRFPSTLNVSFIISSNFYFQRPRTKFDWIPGHRLTLNLFNWPNKPQTWLAIESVDQFVPFVFGLLAARERQKQQRGACHCVNDRPFDLFGTSSQLAEWSADRWLLGFHGVAFWRSGRQSIHRPLCTAFNYSTQLPMFVTRTLPAAQWPPHHSVTLPNEGP